MVSSKPEIIDIISISPNKKIEHNDIDIIDKNITVVEKYRQKRITIYHYVVHILAFLIIIPFVVLIIFNHQIPDSYSTIVSVIIGFYFARSLFW